MTVINTSPTIHLHAVLPGGAGLLPRLIGAVVIPWEVGRELEAGGDRDATWREIQATEGLILRPEAAQIHPLLRNQLDLGEAAVTQTALDSGNAPVILDDLKARRIAVALGLPVTGTLGILILAKRAGHLPSLGDAIASLRKRGMWIEPGLATKAIRLAGESP